MQSIFVFSMNRCAGQGTDDQVQGRGAITKVLAAAKEQSTKARELQQAAKQSKILALQVRI